MNTHQDAAQLVCDVTAHAIASTCRCAIALSGGTTPRALYELLASAPLRDEISWDRVHLFWSDERLVARDHPDSNYAMAHDAMISRVPIPESNVHRVITEKGEPDRVARFYEEQLRAFFGRLPEFDLLLLGMGVDGHTASLFPGDVALYETERWAVAVDGSRATPPVPRVTLTLPVMDNARNVMFLVAGDAKRAIVDEIKNDPDAAAKKYPAAMVRPRGEVRWIIL